MALLSQLINQKNKVMKEIKAFIRTNKVNDVAFNLQKNSFCCFSIFEGDGSGKYSDPDNEYPSLRHPFLHYKIAKLEIVCNKEDEDTIVKIIKEHAHTGKSGDGLIYVSNVEQKVRIRD
jgi:nitrogen regulatory protein P-II 1